MILTTCSACAKPIEHDAPAHCVNCRTRYCSDRCLRYHAHRGGHDDKCDEIARGGGAEQYHADKKHEEAVADAVEECAGDTEGQTCYICLEDGSEEGLVRGCSCRGAAGFAHVSCLVEQAKVLIADAEERGLGGDAFNAKWARWQTCSLCKQEYHGVVRCALGWACWKTYVSRPEEHWAHGCAMSVLGSGLYNANRLEDSVSVYEAELSTILRVGADEDEILCVRSNLANSYETVGRLEEALRMREDIYSGTLDLLGEEHFESLQEANNYADTLCELKRFEEAKALVLKAMPVARRVIGDDHDLTLKLRWTYAEVLYKDDGATLADLREAVTTLEDVDRIARRVLGGAHPTTASIKEALGESRAALRARDAVAGELLTLD